MFFSLISFKEKKTKKKLNEIDIKTDKFTYFT